MTKGHQSSTNETNATAWRQRNANWWSEMKKANHDTTPTAKMANTTGGVMNMNDKATGQFSSTALNCTIAASVERHDKQHLAYHELRNNCTSLMCSSNQRKHTHDCTTLSPVFMQHNIMHNANLTKNTISLTNMRSAIHKCILKIWNTPYLNV
jgi:hypothetical protein